MRNDVVFPNQKEIFYSTRPIDGHQQALFRRVTFLIPFAANAAHSNRQGNENNSSSQ